MERQEEMEVAEESEQITNVTLLAGEKEVDKMIWTIGFFFKTKKDANLRARTERKRGNKVRIKKIPKSEQLLGNKWKVQIR